MDATFRDRAVYLPASDALVCADLHLGRAASAPLALPVDERAPERLDALLSRFAPSEVVLAGDVLHAFDRVPEGTPATVERLDALVERAGARLVVVSGNHDTMLDAVWDGPVRSTHRLGETVVCHGHESPDTEAERYVLGHDHPTIEIEGQRRPCYLHGSGVYRGDDVLVLPAFSRLAAGCTVNGMRADEFQSPLVTDADALRPIVRDEAAEETLWFPPLDAFRRLL
ncbi:metallophosphoesterase [Halobacteriales archaeon QS_4_69_34]|nr:MAG: metallophosphoesterase [Halobacteriales archaeon QS_4_69_34]